MHLDKYKPRHTFKHTYMHGHTQAGHSLLLIFPILECFFGRLSRAAAVCGLAAQTHQTFTKKKLTKLSFIAIPGVDSLHCHTNEGFPYFITIFPPFLFIYVCQRVCFWALLYPSHHYHSHVFFATQCYAIICLKKHGVTATTAVAKEVQQRQTDAKVRESSVCKICDFITCTFWKINLCAVIKMYYYCKYFRPKISPWHYRIWLQIDGQLLVLD